MPILTIDGRQFGLSPVHRPIHALAIDQGSWPPSMVDLSLFADASEIKMRPHAQGVKKDQVFAGVLWD